MRAAAFSEKRSDSKKVFAAIAKPVLQMCDRITVCVCRRPPQLRKLVRQTGDNDA